MASEAAMTVAFVAGAYVELALLTHRHWTRGKLGVILAAAVFMTAWNMIKADGGLLMPLLLALGVTFLFAVLLFRDGILPRVGEHTLIAYTPLYWFLWAVALSPGSPLWWVLLLVGFPASLGTAYLAATRRAPAPRWRMAAYAWYLTLVVTLVGYQFAGSELARVLDGGGTARLTDLFIEGVVFTYLAAHGLHLFQLVRPPGRGDTWSQYLEDKREHAKALGRKFAEAQVRWTHAAALVLTGAAVLATNEALGLLPRSALVGAWLIVGANLDRVPGLQATPGEAASDGGDAGGEVAAIHRAKGE